MILKSLIFIILSVAPSLYRFYREFFCIDGMDWAMLHANECNLLSLVSSPLAVCSIFLLLKSNTSKIFKSISIFGIVIMMCVSLGDVFVTGFGVSSKGDDSSFNFEMFF